MAFIRPMFAARSVARVQRLNRCAQRMSSDSATPMYRAKHILLSSKELADSCKDQLKGGAEFSTMARTLSQCPSKERGGDLGWFKSGMMAEKFEKACRDGAVGDVVTAETEFGHHVIQIDGKASYPGNMSVQEFSEIYNNEDLRSGYQMIDVRERGEYEISKLEGFDLLPMSEYETWADAVEQQDKFDRNKPTVVMCHHGVRSAQMAYYFAQQGFTNVYNLTGGINAWSLGIDENVPRY